MHHHHAGHQRLFDKRDNAGTVFQYVYKTVDPGFAGPIGGYSTVNPPPAVNTPAPSPSASNDDQSTSNQQQQPQQQQQQQQPSQQSSQQQPSQQQEQQQQDETSSSISAAVLAAASQSEAAAAASSAESEQEPTQVASTPSHAEATPTVHKQLDAATSTPAPTEQSSQSPKSHNATPVAATATASETSSPTASLAAQRSSQHSTPATASSSGGMSGGAKAGVAFGVIFAIAAVAALVFLLYRRKKKTEHAEYQQSNDEKAAFDGGLARAQSNVSTRTTATAPRLSLRPVTQFLPDLAGRSKTANAPAAGAASMSQVPNEKENPFGNHAAINQPSITVSDAALPVENNSNTENPFGNHAETAPLANGSVGATADTPAPLRIRTPSPGTVAAAAAGAATVHAAQKSPNLSLNRPASPASQSSVSDVSSQPPPSPGGAPPTNVHRVQLDFKPSMDDELGLHAGQLVRLLHEYDDGWALCIRLDRSQQGVAPRTCLSARPVKPRPPPGARGPGPRGPPGAMGPGQQRPASPASGRGSPAPYNRVPRPNGPNSSQQRSMSPGPYGGGPQRSPNGSPEGAKRRSNSVGDVRERHNSPPGPSPMNPNNAQKVSMQQQAVTPPDGIPRATTPVGRKPVPGQAM